MDDPEGPAATSAADAASVAGSIQRPVQEDVAAGVLSGIGPNADTAAQVAREKGWTEPVPFEYAQLSGKDHTDWAGVAARYEWNDEFGEVGPPNVELEDQLFRGSFITRAGDKLENLNSYKVHVESSDEVKPVTEWENLGLHPVMVQNIGLCRFDRPTAIQSYAIPAVLANQDLIAADEMLDSGWEDEFKRIMSGGDLNEDGDHRYLMFSATFNKEFRKLAKDYLADDHVRLRVGRAGSSHRNVVQDIVWVDQHQKMKALYDLLISMPPVRTLVFVNSKEQVDFVDDYLYNSSMPTTSIHSGRTQLERRTARIGNEGIATSFYNERNEEIAEELVKILVECKQTIPDFLEQYRPANDELNFDDNSEDDFFEAASEADSDGFSEAASDGENQAETQSVKPEEQENQDDHEFGTDDPFVDSAAKPIPEPKESKKSKKSKSPAKKMGNLDSAIEGSLSQSFWKTDIKDNADDGWGSAPSKRDDMAW
ncbi:uncharacterized protein N7506_004781 [Penicillium brevicompactum]|uniref:uncharacterized protein n=1 Tax=Penicillium brevicompactum TaxID=5074 RepID=UPI00253FA1BE|nr:uncharacterized protein N7506_004781 [Penicillium brevicompactum]KAJ5336759.1 hypothetical protein N7506_004781 [Penicillium brevicompactum]